MRLSLDMSLSRDEFLRLLPAAVGVTAIEEAGGSFRGSEGQGRWTIQLQRLEDLCLGRVVLPRHRIDIFLEGYSDEEMAAFLTRFHRGFQRGGG